MLTFQTAACSERLWQKPLTKHVHTPISLLQILLSGLESLLKYRGELLQTHLESSERNLSETNYGNEMPIFTDQCKGVPGEERIDHLKDLSACSLAFSSKVHLLIWDVINSVGIRESVTCSLSMDFSYPFNLRLSFIGW